MLASSKDRGGAMLLLKNLFTKLPDIVCTNQETGLQVAVKRNVMALSSHGSDNSSSICIHVPDQKSDNYASRDEVIAVNDQLLAYRSI